MDLLIRIDLDNAAFEAPNTASEAARILRRAADDMEKEGRIAPRNLMDANGNRCGVVRLVAE